MGKKSKKKDYFKLPFEIHYSEQVPIVQYEFKSDIPVKKFTDIKGVVKQQGGIWGLTLKCANNNGSELFCCISAEHDEVAPPWLSWSNEESMDFNYAKNYCVEVKGTTIKFVELTEEQEDEDSEKYLDIENMDECCVEPFIAYVIGSAKADYLILDSEDTRLEVSMDGYVLDEEGNETEERVFDTDELNDEYLWGFETKSLEDAKAEWVAREIATYFPKEAKLTLSPGSK